jgi:release factor glutamine methyltransferase
LQTVRDLFARGKSLLAGMPDPALEAKQLLLKSCGIPEESFYSHPGQEIPSSQESAFLRLVSARLKGVPLAYVLGEKEFWSMGFKVAPGVLIPRPETEILVEKVIALATEGSEIIADIGTGSGNIAVSVAIELPQAGIVASDISAKALSLARINAGLQKVSNIRFERGSLFGPLQKLGFRGKCDVIVSNPPYVSLKEWETLPGEIRDHEPRKALVAGESGLEIIKKLIRRAPAFLRPGGYLCLEIGYGQEQRVLSLFGSGWGECRSYPDLSGIPRVVTGRTSPRRS